ncbi:MAG: S26 family signal peptidase, partial [Planctomycetaceae bacterium]|nr:S26 family signal peptidase [Planctomycetaceae bacterium]
MWFMSRKPTPSRRERTEGPASSAAAEAAPATETAAAGDGAPATSGAAGTPASPAGDQPAEPAGRRQDAFRETVESIVIAFILAFLFRTFEAEAFVIPTGSMAPTLMGRHKDIRCEECGFWYQVGASTEIV